jgi:hypothetical protein
MIPVDWDNLPPTTIPARTTISVRDFTNDDAATRLGETVASMAGTIMDLSRLDGVTVAIDYDAALAGLDRGMEGLQPLSRSDTEEMQGVAMSPAVMRDGEVRTHLVFNAEMLVPLIAEGGEVDADDRAKSIGIIAHECAHVQITMEKELAIPEARLGTRIEGYERAVMFQLAEVFWDEYAACRLSAPLATKKNATHASTVAACASGAHDRSDAAIRSYRVHGDLDRLQTEAGPALAHPMKAAAYLLGGLDAISADCADTSSTADARQALITSGYDGLVDDLHAELRRLWETRADWGTTLAVFAGLEDIARATFDAGGLVCSTSANGQCRIDVPFTASTMPGA